MKELVAWKSDRKDFTNSLNNISKTSMKINMNKNIIRNAIAILGLCAVATLPARADITYSIQDVGTFTDYEDFNTSDTFAGTGFVGIYPNSPGPGPAFAHLLGLENYDGVFSETEMQVDISALAGATITSAILSYNLLNGGDGSEGVTATSYTTTGSLGFNQTPPNNLGSTTFTSTGLSANSVDVTALLQAAINANQNWFGLYLTPNGPGDNYQWTYTYSGFEANPDSAGMLLTVKVGAVEAVPEPTTMIAGALLLLPFGAGTMRLLRKGRAA
jgi:hypothetical protein